MLILIVLFLLFYFVANYFLAKEIDKDKQEIDNSQVISPAYENEKKIVENLYSKVKILYDVVNNKFKVSQDDVIILGDITYKKITNFEEVMVNFTSKGIDKYIKDMGSFFAYSNGKENLEKVTNSKLDKYKKIIFYMPTFRKGCDREQESSLNQNNIFNLEPYQEEKLVEFLKQNDYLLCIKKHPSEELNTVDLQNENIKIIKEEDLINNNITINEILNASDLMITDYSSLGVEYLFFNKPVIYINTDSEEYSQNRGIIFGNSDFWMVGDKVHQIDGLLSSIDSALQSDYKPSEEYLQKRQLWFGDLKDGGCENICNYFFNGYKLNKDLVRRVDYIKLYKDRVDEVSKILDEKNEVIADRENRIKELDIFISNIINSKGWKFLEKIRGVKKVFKKKN